jgi:uncharacterized protein
MLTKIQNDMKQAMKAGEKLRLSTIRLLLASIKNVAIEKRQELEESEIISYHPARSKAAQKRHGGIYKRKA